MRIILSRKGFDSSSGMYPSPILPDGRIISFPIPDEGDKDRYSRLLLNNSKTTYFDLLKELGINNFNEQSTCHLDPDIYWNIKERQDNWKGAFGQINAAQTHLENQNVTINDVFLFFGWFRNTETKNGKLCFKGPDMHVIFGYLQIGKIYRNENINDIPEYLKEHPHYSIKRRSNPTNAIYVAKDHLSIDKNYPGYGVFQFNKLLKLTKDGFNRSCWNLPSFFRNLNISYHNLSHWKEDYFQSTYPGQEFVVEENEEVKNWALKIIKESHTKYSLP
ncbi:MAG: hypothetical protein JST15_07840 [Bacteroidetes bacterium]|nr:hypothetical protein [Bacteroidota bacterium]